MRGNEEQLGDFLERLGTPTVEIVEDAMGAGAGWTEWDHEAQYESEKRQEEQGAAAESLLDSFDAITRDNTPFFIAEGEDLENYFDDPATVVSWAEREELADIEWAGLEHEKAVETEDEEAEEAVETEEESGEIEESEQIEEEVATMR